MITNTWKQPINVLNNCILCTASTVYTVLLNPFQIETQAGLYRLILLITTYLLSGSKKKVGFVCGLWWKAKVF